MIEIVKNGEANLVYINGNEIKGVVSISAFNNPSTGLVTMEILDDVNMREAVNLRYDYVAADKFGEKRHAQEVFDGLGITYKKFIPQTIGDQIWFSDCQNIPENLPDYITVIDFDISKYLRC